jgi:HAE1 family hydrophobic/amphiphilic exporter-1
MSRRRVRVQAKQRSDQQLVTDLRKDLADIPSATLKVATEGGMGGGGGGDVQLSILCEDQDQLNAASADLVQKVGQIPGLLYTDLSSKPGRPEIHADIDRARAADLGMDVAKIGSAVRTAFSGDTSIRQGSRLVKGRSGRTGIRKAAATLCERLSLQG